VLIEISSSADTGSAPAHANLSGRSHFAEGTVVPVVGVGALAEGAAGSAFGFGTVDLRSHAPSTLITIAASAMVTVRPV